MSLADHHKKENERLRRDQRTRSRLNMLKVNGPAPIDQLPDLVDTTVPFNTPQPALGVAATIPGCNCQVCKKTSRY